MQTHTLLPPLASADEPLSSAPLFELCFPVAAPGMPDLKTKEKENNYLGEKGFRKIKYLSTYPEERLQRWSNISDFFLGFCLTSHFWWSFD